jgi:RNA polymerase sigma-70 factor (ECF subfamily)
METNEARGPTGIDEDPDAFEAFYRAHIETVRRFVARRVSDPHLAADLTADVFLAAIDAAGTYRPGRGNPSAWLVGVARNVLASEFRRQTRQQNLHRRISGSRLLDADSISRLEERIDAERETRRLYAALSELHPRDRLLIELVAIDGLTVADAAKQLDIRPATARVRLHRARHFMQSHLQLQLESLSTEAPS